MNDQHRQAVQAQFGRNAENYVTGRGFSEGYSLGRLLELAAPSAGWCMLDIATGGGHTAARFGDRCRMAVASDLTFRMLTAARRRYPELVCCQHDAEHVPYPDGSFDAVTCRIAPHHFPSIDAFVMEVARVLKPGGLLAIADNVASPDRKVARYVDALETLRDPSHHLMFTLPDWEAAFYAAGVSVTHTEAFHKTDDFDGWAGRMGVSADDTLRLRAMVLQAPPAVQEWMQPRQKGSRIEFLLHEVIILGRKVENGSLS